MGEYKNKTEQTKNKIRQVLLELLEKESINQISTSQIARKAEINRVTLYRHFDDKWEILESIEDEFLELLIEPHSKMRLRLQKEHDLNTDQPVNELLQFLNVFHDNLTLLKILMNNSGDSDFTNKLMRFLMAKNTQNNKETVVRMGNKIGEKAILRKEESTCLP